MSKNVLTVIILCLRLPYHLKCHRHDQKKINRSEVLPDGYHGQQDDDHTQGSELHWQQLSLLTHGRTVHGTKLLCSVRGHVIWQLHTRFTNT